MPACGQCGAMFKRPLDLRVHQRSCPRVPPEGAARRQPAPAADKPVSQPARPHRRDLSAWAKLELQRLLAELRLELPGDAPLPSFPPKAVREAGIPPIAEIEQRVSLELRVGTVGKVQGVMQAGAGEVSYDLGVRMHLDLFVKEDEAVKALVSGTVELASLTQDELESSLPQYEWRCEHKQWRPTFDELAPMLWPGVQDKVRRLVELAKAECGD